MIKIAPSILSADCGYMADDIKMTEQGGAEYLHIDIMDGVFVPNISYGPGLVKGIRKYSNQVFDVHLMIVNPEKYIKQFAEAGSDIITFHYEATDKIDECIDMIKSFGKKAGISIKPATDPKVLLPYLDKLDMVLVMSVEPGFGGQSYMPQADDKMRYLKSVCRKETEISVDGGVNLENAKHVMECGADVVVAGSAIFGAEDIVETTKKFVAMTEEFSDR